MSKPIDLTGQIFGRLTAVKIIGKHKTGKPLWECDCTCGNKAYAMATDLRRKRVTSCGCYRKDLAAERGKIYGLIYGGYGKKDPGISMQNYEYDHVRRNAIKRGYAFELTMDQFLELSQQPCFYCGIEPSRIVQKKGHNGAFICNGIDRLNNHLGYVYYNCVASCQQCNALKNGVTPAMIIKLYHALNERGFIQDENSVITIDIAA